MYGNEKHRESSEDYMNKRTTNTLAIEDFQKDNNVAFGILYRKYFGYTRKFVLSNKGNSEDAEDVFQDALIILYEKFMMTISKPTLVLRTTLPEFPKIFG